MMSPQTPAAPMITDMAATWLSRDRSMVEYRCPHCRRTHHHCIDEDEHRCGAVRRTHCVHPDHIEELVRVLVGPQTRIRRK